MLSVILLPETVPCSNIISRIFLPCVGFNPCGTIWISVKRIWLWAVKCFNARNHHLSSCALSLPLKNIFHLEPFITQTEKMIVLRRNSAVRPRFVLRRDLVLGRPHGVSGISLLENPTVNNTAVYEEAIINYI